MTLQWVMVYFFATFGLIMATSMSCGKIWRWRRVACVAAYTLMALAAFLPSYNLTVQMGAFLLVPCGIKMMNRQPWYAVRQSWLTFLFVLNALAQI